MSSKIRVLGDGTGDLYLQCYFSQLSSPSSTLFDHLKPGGGATDAPFEPSLKPIPGMGIQPITVHQLLTKRRLVSLPINIRLVYTGMAQLLEISHEEITDRMRNNFSRLFG